MIPSLDVSSYKVSEIGTTTLSWSMGAARYLKLLDKHMEHKGIRLTFCIGSH